MKIPPIVIHCPKCGGEVSVPVELREVGFDHFGNLTVELRVGELRSLHSCLS